MEVLVVDDASSDGTGAMIAALADPRIRVVRNATSLGESGARNRGVDEAAADWIAFLDDDDVWAPDKLVLQLDGLRETGREWAYGGDVIVDLDLNVLYGSPPPSPELVAKSLVRYNSIPSGASNVIVSAELLARVGPFDPTLRRTPDWDMWLRLLRVGLPAVVPRPLVANCVHRGNVSRDMSVLFRELDVITARHRIPVDRAKHYRWAAWSSRMDGRRADAVRYYAHAVMAGDVSSIGRALATLMPSRSWSSPSRTPNQSGLLDEWTDQARAWLEPFKAEAR